MLTCPVEWEKIFMNCLKFGFHREKKTSRIAETHLTTPTICQCLWRKLREKPPIYEILKTFLPQKFPDLQYAYHTCII